MAKQVRFIQLELKNFAGIRKLDEKYGDITKLSGQNGEGKTTFGEAPAWIFFGTDLFGNRFNPSPTTYEFDRVYASLRLSVDGEEMTFTREINENGVNEFCISYVPAKAKEYEAAVAELFSKEEFLSLYNPGFFFTQHWTKQREQIMKHALPPAKSDVFAEMSRTSKEQKVKDIVLNPAAAKLDELTKKHSLDDLQKIHGGTGGQKAKLEKQHIAAQSRTKTLREQYDRLPDTPADIEAVNAESAALMEKIQKISPQIEKAKLESDKRSALQAQVTAARQLVDAAKDRYMKVYNEPIEDACPTCQRPFDDAARQAATDSKDNRKHELHAEHAALVAKWKELKEQLDALELVDVSDLWNEMRELERKRDDLEDMIHAEKDRESLKADVEAAKKAEDDTLAALKESIFILDAIKAYRAKEAELQAEKVQSLFTRLKIRLFKHVKTTGEYEPYFSIQMDGKDYATLSVGEKITAGLELTEVLFKQSELIVPTFIDGIGEYTGEIAVYGQLITARAIKGQEFKIETEAITAA